MSYTSGIVDNVMFSNDGLDGHVLSFKIVLRKSCNDSR